MMVEGYGFFSPLDFHAMWHDLFIYVTCHLPMMVPWHDVTWCFPSFLGVFCICSCVWRDVFEHTSVGLFFCPCRSFSLVFCLCRCFGFHVSVSVHIFCFRATWKNARNAAENGWKSSTKSWRPSKLKSRASEKRSIVPHRLAIMALVVVVVFRVIIAALIVRWGILDSQSCTNESLGGIFGGNDLHFKYIYMALACLASCSHSRMFRRIE